MLEHFQLNAFEQTGTLLIELEHFRSNAFNERFWSIELFCFWMNAFEWMLSIECFWLNAFDWTLSIECFQLNAFDWTLLIERFRLNAFNIYWMSAQMAISSIVPPYLIEHLGTLSPPILAFASDKHYSKSRLMSSTLSMMHFLVLFSWPKAY